MSIDQLMLSLPEGCSLWRIDTSFVETQWLLVTPNNRKFQVSAKASDVISEILDERKSLADLANTLSAKWQVPVMSEDVLTIIESAYWPQDLLRKSTPWESEAVLEASIAERTSKSLFGDFFIRFTVLPEAVVRRIAAHLTGLYHHGIALLLLVAIVGVHFLLFRYLAAQPSWAATLSLSPSQYVAAFGLMVGSVLFHELGHATAAAAFGVQPGAIGCGIYFIYPAFYTELGFAWLLPRGKRMVVDVGGFYFQLLTTLPLYLAFFLSGSRVTVLVILSIDFLIGFSLIPFFKFDGYWLLADLLGIPNLQKHAMELLGSPQKIVRNKFFTTKKGLQLPRWLSLSLLVYGALFLLFQIGIALLIFKNGPAFIFAAPVKFYTLAQELFAEVAAGQLMLAAQQGIRILMLLVTTLALILIFKSYLRLFLYWGKKYGNRLWRASAGVSASAVSEGRNHQ
ncbi:MAG: hypothetical protein HY231_21275 [Acidobacteria bacterium]|nr:hypothetical protein [Acidobacteriota bacterium]